MHARALSLNPPPTLLRVGLRLEGKLVFDTLQRTLDEIVRRHAAFRTGFAPNPHLTRSERDQRLARFARTGVFDPGVFMQLPSPGGPVAVHKVDASGLADDARDAVLRERLEKEYLQPLDHGRPPLLRATLMKFHPDDHLLLIFLEHLVGDGWSLSVIRDEFRRLYPVMGPGRQGSVVVPEPGISFPEFVAWQNRALETAYFIQAVNYWREQWIRFGPARVSVREIPFSLPAANTPDFAFASEFETIDGTNSQSIRRWAGRCGVSLFGVFLSALALLLCRYTQRSSTAIWSHLANRTRADSLNAVGWFANTHILGFNLSANPNVRELLVQVQEVVKQALIHQGLPLPHLWRTLQCVPRFPHPVVLMDFRAVSRSAVRGADAGETMRDLAVRNAELPPYSGPRLAPFGIYLNDDRKNISLTVQYTRARFAPDGVRRFLIDLRSMVSEMSAAPDRRAGDFVGARWWKTRDCVAPDSEMSDFLLLDSRLIPAAPETNLPPVTEVV